MAEETAPKKRKLSLSLKERRFKLVSEKEVSELEKTMVPKSTDACNRWAMKIFREWLADYNDRNPEDKCPDIVLSSSSTVPFSPPYPPSCFLPGYHPYGYQTENDANENDWFEQ